MKKETQYEMVRRIWQAKIDKLNKKEQARLKESCEKDLTKTIECDIIDI